MNVRTAAPAQTAAGTLHAMALALGERIDFRGLHGARAAAGSVASELDGGFAVVFRYGCVVFFDVPAPVQDRFLAEIRELVVEPFADPEHEETEFALSDDGTTQVREDGITIGGRTPETLQVVGDVLAKSVALAHYESSIADAFDEIEPLAIRLQRSGKLTRRFKVLVQHIASALLTQHRMVGRIEISEKPELLWERPKLERTYAWLAEEYELRERSLALERKLKLVAHTAEVLLDLLQTRRTLRVEWYIVILIVFEICLTLYEMLGL